MHICHEKPSRYGHCRGRPLRMLRLHFHGYSDRAPPSTAPAPTSTGENSQHHNDDGYISLSDSRGMDTCYSGAGVQ